MALSLQIYSLAYHFIAGMLFAFCFSFLSLFLIRMKNIARILFLNIFCLSFTLCFFYGLYHLNNGITHGYAILFFLLGLLLYYQGIYGYCLPAFLFLMKTLSPFVRKGRVAKKKMYAIIIHGKGKKGSRKKERNRWKKAKQTRNAQ